MRGLLFSASAALFCAASAIAQTPPTTSSATAVLRSDYIADEQLYARLRVRLTYGDPNQPIVLDDQCPRGNLWGEGLTFERFLRATQTLNLGFTVQTPSGQSVQLSPVQIEVQKPVLPWEPVKCNVQLHQITYVSPLFSIQRYSGQQFFVSPDFYIRRRPDNDWLELTTGSLEQLAKLVRVPDPIAAQFGLTAQRTLGAAGDNQTIRMGVSLPLTPSAQDRTRAVWTANPGLEGGHLIHVEATLENVGSIVAPTSAAVPQAPEPMDILRAAVTTERPQLETLQDVIRVAAGNHLEQFNSKGSAAEANDSCINVGNSFRAQGLSTVDQALSVWALARTHPRLAQRVTPEMDLDQTACLRSWSGVLQRAGIALGVNNPVVSPGVNDMSASIENGNAVARFFSRTTPQERGVAASRFFVSAPSFSDPSRLVFSHTGQALTNNDQWSYNLADASARMLDRIDCFAYLAATNDAAASAWAIGQRGDSQFAVRLEFPATARSARVGSLHVLPSLTEPQRRAILDGLNAQSCGVDDWRPALLFGP